MTGQQSLLVLQLAGMRQRNQQVGIKSQYSIGSVSAAHV